MYVYLDTQHTYIFTQVLLTPRLPNVHPNPKHMLEANLHPSNFMGGRMDHSGHPNIEQIPMAEKICVLLKPS